MQAKAGRARQYSSFCDSVQVPQKDSLIVCTSRGPQAFLNPTAVIIMKYTVVSSLY